jgi:hypothetical protein
MSVGEMCGRHGATRLEDVKNDKMLACYSLSSSESAERGGGDLLYSPQLTS